MLCCFVLFGLLSPLCLLTWGVGLYVEIETSKTEKKKKTKENMMAMTCYRSDEASAAQLSTSRSGAMRALLGARTTMR